MKLKQNLFALPIVLTMIISVFPISARALTYQEIVEGQTGQVLGVTTANFPYPSNSLVNDGGVIYYICGSSKIPFTNYQAFVGLGYSLANVVSGSLASYTPATQYFLTTANAEHPWCSWLNVNGTVYYSHQTGMIKVPTWQIFLNNGGLNQYIVNANSYDLAVLKANPNLPILQNNDPRVYLTPTSGTVAPRLGAAVQLPGQTSGAIYLVGSNYLYWFPTSANYSGWGFTAANTVQANSAEAQLPISPNPVPDKLPCFNDPLDQINSGATSCAPVISNFTASSTSITAGSSSTLSWNISNVAAVSIDQNVGPQASTTNGSVSVSPAQTTTYNLTAANTWATSTAEVTVGVTVVQTASSTPQVLSQQLVIPGYDIYSPDVMYDGGVYKMWFGGWLTQADSPHDKIYYTTSTDQVHWASPVMVQSMNGVLNEDPSVIKLSNDSYVMFFTYLAPGSWDQGVQSDYACDDPTYVYNITYMATSPDGINWQNPHQIIGPSNGVTNCGAWSPSLMQVGNQYWDFYHDNNLTYVLLSVFDSNFNLLSTRKITNDGLLRANLNVEDIGGTWRMFYNAPGYYPGTNIQGMNTIKMMTSADGLNWDTSHAIVIVPPQTGDNKSAILTPYAQFDANDPSTFDLYFGIGDQAPGQLSSQINMWRMTLGSGTPTPASPVISSFTASPATITVGGSSKLSWNVSASSTISINNNVGPQTSASASVSVSPLQPTTYTLTAVNSVGTSTATTNVTVTPAPGSIRVGQLVQKPGDTSGAIYVVAETGLYWFPTYTNFSGWGLSTANVKPTNSSEMLLPTLGQVPNKLSCFNFPLDQIRSGATSCSDSMVRVGQLVNNVAGALSGAIYLVGKSQIYWFPNYTNFTGWGYSTANTKPINAAESQLSQGPNVPDKLPCFQNPLDQIDSGMTSCPN